MTTNIKLQHTTPNYVELNIKKGSTFRNVINITDSITNNVSNISGYTIRSSMRKSYYSQNATDIVCTITDAANGVITMSLANGNTANLQPGRYVFDVEGVESSNINSLLEGLIIVAPEVTR